MARDIPEFQRRKGINPGSPTSGFAQAGTNLGAGSRMLGQASLGIAKNAAIQQATIDGVKAGQTPGRTLLPAFSDTDKAFVDAYKKEEFQTVSRTGNSYINKMYSELSKNPTPEGLTLFQKNSQAQIEKLTSLVSEENQPHLRRSLEEESEQKFYSLSKSVEGKIKQNQKNDFELNQQMNVRRFTESIVTGFADKAEKEYFEGNDQILSQVGTDAVPTQAYASALIAERDREYQAAKLQKELHTAQQEKKDPEFWAERAKLPPTAENMEINAALTKQQSMYKNMVGMQSHIALNEALAKARSGTLTEAMKLDYQDKMGPSDLSKFNYKLAKLNLDDVQKTQNIDYINKNASNDVLMAMMKGKDLDAAFEDKLKNFSELQGREPSLDEMANLASTIAAPIPAFNKRLGSMINSANPENAVVGSDIYNRMMSTHPRTVDDIDEKTGSKAYLIRDLVSKDIDPIEAVKYANNQVDGLRPQDIEDLHKSFLEQVKSNDLNTPSIQHAKINKWLDINDYDYIEPGVYTDFMENMKRNYLISGKSGNWEIAKERAINEIKRVYGEQTINGRKEFVWLPINKDTPYADNENYLRNLLIRKTEKMFKAQTENNQFGYSYRYNEKDIIPEENILYKSRQTKEGPIKIERVDNDGSITKGELIIKADKHTDLPTPGRSPSRGIYFLADGKVVPTPIYDASRIGEVARFSLNEEDLKEADSLRSEGDEAAFLRFKRNKIIQQEIDKNLTEQVRGTLYE